MDLDESELCCDPKDRGPSSAISLVSVRVRDRALRYPRPKCHGQSSNCAMSSAQMNAPSHHCTTNNGQVLSKVLCQITKPHKPRPSSSSSSTPSSSTCKYLLLLILCVLLGLCPLISQASQVATSVSPSNVSHYHHLSHHHHHTTFHSNYRQLTSPDDNEVFDAELDASSNVLPSSTKQVDTTVQQQQHSHITNSPTSSTSDDTLLEDVLELSSPSPSSTVPVGGAAAASPSSDDVASQSVSSVTPSNKAVKTAHENDDLDEDGEDLLANNLKYPLSTDSSANSGIIESTHNNKYSRIGSNVNQQQNEILKSDFKENLIHSEVTTTHAATASSTTIGAMSSKPKESEGNSINLDFTRLTYNVSIPENAIYKYATPAEKMGIYISDPALSVRYKIVAGDPDKIFKAEAKHVGNFYFLMIRIRYGNNQVLNREYLASYELRVRATITSSRNEILKLKSKCNVYVTVEDRNDISPIFFSDTYDVDVPEDVPLDTSVIKVTADDPDIGRNGEIYYSLADDTQLFAIHPTMGVIYTTRPLTLKDLVKSTGQQQHHGHRRHRDTPQEHTIHLTVLAKDRGFHQGSASIIESSKARVNIRITPVNRHLPRISIKQHSTLATSFTTVQRRPIFAVVHVSDQDLGVYGEICSFEIVSGNEANLFTVANTSNSRDYNLELAGSVSELSQSLLSTQSSPIKVMVKATDCGGRSSNETVTISPESQLTLGFAFTSDNYHRDIRENSLIGTQIVQVDLKLLQNEFLTPSSADIQNKDQFHFSIISGNENDTFGISRNGVIYNRVKLDRERVSKYTLVVRAAHELNRIATTMVHIEVLDDNDNYPLFRNVSADQVVHLSVAENKPNGSVIYRVEATDADLGNNAYITYELVHYGIDELPFAIDSYSGDIYTVRQLDFEALPRQYHLFVRASDWGEPFRRQSQMLLNISVLDVNDHRPQFEKTNCTAYVPVTIKPLTEIMTFSAVDLDQGSKILYKMFTPEADKCFRLNEQTGTLELICNLKKEISRSAGKMNSISWTLSISATDGNYFSDPNYLKVIVVGQDSTNPATNTVISHSASHDKRNVRVECTDSIVRNNKVTTTQLDTESLLPDEKEAIESMRAAQLANEVPVFDQILPEISIPENTILRTKIATFSANDTDSGFAGSLVWSLNLQQIDDKKNNQKVYFEINQFTGELLLISELDYEQEKSISLLVTVCDQSLLSQKCANQSVAVMLEDVNDNSPLLDNFTFNISEAAPVHTVIGTLYATDEDSGDNAALEYFIDSHSDMFSVDLFNGTLRLEKPLDREEVAKYNLYATVSDSGTPVLTSTSSIIINVNDVNDNKPEFFQKSYFLKVREDIPIGTRLTRISAFDRDEDEAAEIRYSLADTLGGTFAIDELNGNIRLRKSLDYERNQLYNLTVTATDEGKPPLSSSTFLIIEVEDVDENYHAPKFSDFYATASIKENMPVGTFVVKVVATDDDDPSIPLIYQIIGGSGLGRFTIDAAGTVTTTAVLDTESNSHFWLTIVAKDRAAVPLTATLELYISVEDMNDMPPITTESFYHTKVYENVTIGTVIMELQSRDQDLSTKSKENPDILYRISNQVPFVIDLKGVIKTSGELDRESVSRYVIDVEVMEPLHSDSSNAIDKRSSEKYLMSRTPVIVDVLDVNEFEPKSSLHTYRCYSFTNSDKSLPVCQIIAFDRDLDEHCQLRYELLEGGEIKHFRLDTSSGIFYPTSDGVPKGSYDFIVQISDCGKPALSSTVHVIIRVLNIPKQAEQPNSKPIIEPIDPVITVNRDDPVGSEVAFIKTMDDDFDKLCSYIISGNVDNTFAFLDTGALVVAKSLKNRFVSHFNLTLMVTDGVDNSTLSLMINVHNDIDQVTPFTEENYTVNVLENITVGSDVLHLNLMDNDLGASTNYVFSIYSTQSPDSLTKFEIESWSGKLKVKNSLDFESGKQHVLLIEARSSRKHASSFNNRSFAKVIINVIDVNDQVPQFILSHFETNVLESSAIGTSILQVQAFDGDFGSNAAINYSIVSGNLDGAFDIEPDLGYIYLKKSISFQAQPEYYLVVKATDYGLPPLSSTTNVHILVTIPDNSPPKFEQANYFVDIREDEKVGTVILSLRMSSKQATFFEIARGNDDNSFAINVNNGEIYLRKRLDYERVNNYSLTVSAASLFGVKDTAKVFVTVIDVNDNAPFWKDTIFEGQVYETMPVNSIVLTEEGSPLVVRAYDNDSMHNSILVYSIVEESARQYFKIEPRTGAITLIKRLDYEKAQDFSLSVSVSDYGFPSLKAVSNALVKIKCLPVNDCPPVFTLNKYHATLLLPTYQNVIITKQVTATDCDIRVDNSNNSADRLQYNFTLSEQSKLFRINSTTGMITTASDQFETGLYELEVTAYDGKFLSHAKVLINAKPLPRSSLRYKHERFYGTITENSSMVKTVITPAIEGTKLHEHLIFRIMNPTEHFRIARTSGAILFRGAPVDREEVAKFELAIEVQSITLKHRVAHALVEIKVEDVNDNRPIFVGLPYHFVCNLDSTVGAVINKVQAVDMDVGENGAVTYSIVSGDSANLFSLNSKTGQMTLSRPVDESKDRYNYTLLVMAKDSGEPALESFTNVTLRMVSGGVPVFSKSHYNVTISEAHPPLVPFVTIKAESPNGRQLFYNIDQGNENEEFALDFNTDLNSLANTLCMVSIAEKLDRETTSRYTLSISATDSITGASSAVNLYIYVEDVNDNQPMFSKFSYNVSVPENFPVGSPLLKVAATDSDIGLNSKLQYHIVGNRSQFYMSPDDGIIFLKSALDHETDDTHHFTIMVTDYGSPQLTSTAQVWVEVVDINDNAPTLPATFNTTIDEDIEKGEFVTKITANDLDWSDRSNLRYRILSGSDMAFVMNETSGALHVRNLKNSRYYYHHLMHGEHHRGLPNLKRHYSLNVSVSDGVYSTTELYHINIKPANHFSPKFSRIMNNVAISEGLAVGEHVFTINATDRDDSEYYGLVEYSILNDYGRKYFSIDQQSGRVTLRSKLDYEKSDKFYWLVLAAQDKGKRLGVSALRVAITDLNDNVPRFIVDEYKSTVCSNVPSGSTILSVMAVDDDVDAENKIKYSIYEEKRNDSVNSTNVTYINDYFEISSDTGYIYTRKNLSALEGKMVQFFVKVTNLNLIVPGQKNLIENVVPVTIQVSSSCATQKKDAFLYEVFVKENVERGSVLANINLDGYKDVDLSIVGHDDKSDSARFRIDKFGRVFINEPLDRELKSKHILAIQLKDKLTFMVDYFYLIINIMDENDCTPYFDSASYYISVAENQETGSSIFKVNAIDKDSDVMNSALKYSIDPQEDSFGIDENSGWIVLNRALDRETVANYNLKIVVTDGVHTNSTILHIEVVDVNDNAPVAEKASYIAAIFENSLLGTVVLSVEASDPDLNSDLRYFITDGDYLNQFAISTTGDVYVNKLLDREFIERYSLKILITDGKYQTETEVALDILDVNDNGPICVKSKYVEMVSEAVPEGTYILTVDAIDEDDVDNAKLFYTLQGNHKGHFAIDETSGRLKTNAKLDRETQSVYLFTAVVYDAKNRDWHCTSYIEILLSDVNDEPPKFLSQVNSVNIPEDSPVGIILGKVTAIDLDLGANRKLRYDLLRPTGEFVINERSGIIRLTKSLDRETKSQYNISIMAYDTGASQLNSTTYFVVNVTDINDNAPEFEMQSYSGAVDENAPVGTTVVKIFATSKDTGINAEIKYMIVTGNENDTFSMHPKTGLVTLNKPLDYENIREYFLTIKAEDEGIPPLSTEVNLRIAVNDINDVRPQFVQRSYDIVIREDAHVGDRILQLVAIDLDSPPNANLTYSFAGDRLEYKEFNIDPILGILTVGRQLDREMMSAYILEVFCTDNGHPNALFSSVLINVEISDFNDNPPLYDKMNQTIHIQEGRPVGYTLINFVITDADSSLNSGPFKFTITEGNELNAFSVMDGDASLRTNVIFNHTLQSEYRLAIQVTDSGNPPLSTTNWVHVNVIQEPQMPPKLYPLSITVNSLDQFPGGIIGQVNASDEDRFDKLTYSLTNDDDKNIFSIDSNDGTLVAFPGLDVGKYKVNVTVTDGKFTSYGIVEVEVILLTESMVEHALVIEVRSVSVKEFVTNYMKNFVRVIKNLLNVRAKDVVILSLQPAERKSLRRLRSDEQVYGDISIMFAVANTHGSYFTRNWLKGKLAENKFRIENQLGLAFEEVLHKSECERIRCKQGDCREDLVLSENEITSIVSAKVSFVSPFHEYRFGCSCHPGYGGKLCNLTVNECARNPCPPHKECLPVTSSLGYVCQCAFGKSGPSCNQNAETCHSNDRDVSFCYQESNPISFNGNSYVRYGFVKKIDKISLRFRTQQQRAKIFTQQGEHAFSILEIAGGYVQYRFDCGEGEGLIRVHNLMVNDGKWHEIIVERKGSTATLILDRKHRGGGFAPGAVASCSRLKDDIYFGGEVKSISKTVGDEEILNGFVGCLDNILFNGQQIPFHTTSTSSVVSLKTLANVEFSCNFKADIGACRSQPCMNGGTCQNMPNGSYSCQCSNTRYVGIHCEVDTKPCESNPCSNGGVCVVDAAMCASGLPNCYKCECGAGYTGSNCQLSRYCTSTLCQNGGVCEETALGPKCHCHAGWLGLYCQNDIDECLLSTPACYSPATCINLPGTFRCICPHNSSVACNGEALIPSNIVSSPFHISFKEVIVLVAVLLSILFIAVCMVCCWNCRNRNRKNRTPKHKHDPNEILLKNQSNAIYENLNGNYATRPSKTSNLEMNSLQNNILLGQNRTSYNELINNFTSQYGVLSSEDYEAHPASLTSNGPDANGQFNNSKKNAPIASVSPQLIEIKKSPKNLKGARNKNSLNDLIKQSPQNRVSLNDSSDSTVFNDEQPPSLTNSNPAEGYHWDNLDLYMPDGAVVDSSGMSNLVEFNGHLVRNRDHLDHDSDHISEHSQTESLLTESQQKLFYEKSKTRRISKGSSNGNTSVKTAHLNGEESSPLLSASGSAGKIDPASSSPSLEAKVNLSGNFLEYYLPKHDDEWTSGLNHNYKRKNILQYPGAEEDNNNNNNGKKKNKDKTTNGHSKTNSTSELSQKPMTLLTFNPNHRSSLNESADNFSLLTPSSSTSTTPIAALAKSSSISDTTNDQCSSSLSSGSNPSEHNSKSPVNLYSNNGQHLYANTGPNSLTSFGYGTVNLTNGKGAHINNGKDTIVVSKLNSTNTKSLDHHQVEQTKPKLGSTQTTYV